MNAQRIFHRIFSLDVPKGDDGRSVERGYLLTICTAMHIDGDITEEEMADAIHLVGQFYDSDTDDITQTIRAAIEEVRSLGLEETADLAAELLPEREQRARAIQMIAFIHDADEFVSPIESALLGWAAEAFGFDKEELNELCAELDARVARTREQLEALSVPQTPANNPFLAYEELPRYPEVEPWQLEPAIETLLPELTAALETLESDAPATWDGLIVPLERINARMGFPWGLTSHLLAVDNSDELRAAYQKVQPELVAFSIRVGQSKPLFEKFEQLADSGDLDEGQRRIVDSLIRDATHSGVGLEGDDKERFNEIQQELARLSTAFSNNVLDATKQFELLLTEEDEIAGLPPSFLALSAQMARQAGHVDATAEEGPWRVTLEGPSIMPFLRNAECRDLREKIYRAYMSRASSGEVDNTELITQILKLRREEAALLGYDSYADLSLSGKMAPSVTSVEHLIEDLRGASYDHAVEDLNQLSEYAREQGAAEADDLKHWDISFWAERLREDRYRYSDEEIRPYFPLPTVLNGLFSLVEKIFGVRIEQADGDAPIWHEDVSFFHVFDGDDRIASFYFDPYSRPASKRGGAWQGSAQGRSAALASAGEEVRLPVSYMVCNQTPPVEDKPAQMTFSEVTTLFHEFGHALQHMLTEVDYGMASGTRNIEWDAVELPSQFMENWCYEPEIMRSLTAHVDTGESIPDEYIDKIRAARTYRAGSGMLRQLYFGLLDMTLHADYDPDQDDASVFEVQRDIASKTSVLGPFEDDRFLCAFEHIFAGGYAAGYYSYKWAEVLSADAFAAFEEAGLDDDDALAETGRRFRETVLASGGSRDPMQVFEDFRGRAPSTEPLLRHNGLAS